MRGQRVTLPVRARWWACRETGGSASALAQRASEPAGAWVPLNPSEWYSGTAGTASSAPSLIPGAAAISSDGRGATPVRDWPPLCSPGALPCVGEPSWAYRPYLSGRCPGGAGVRASSRRSRASRCINSASRRRNFTQTVSSRGRLPLLDQRLSLLSAQSGSTAAASAFPRRLRRPSHRQGPWPLRPSARVRSSTLPTLSLVTRERLSGALVNLMRGARRADNLLPVCATALNVRSSLGVGPGEARCPTRPAPERFSLSGWHPGTG
jgi:hypothetical protein